MNQLKGVVDDGLDVVINRDGELVEIRESSSTEEGLYDDLFFRAMVHCTF